MSLADPLERAALAIALLAIDPEGLGGLTLRARAGPGRDAATALLDQLPMPRKRLHPGISDEALFGGLDLAATLASGQMQTEAGILSEPATLILTSAERTPARLAARLALAVQEGHCLIALDEGAEADEIAPVTLTESLAFHVDLSDVSYDAAAPRYDITAARNVSVETPDDAIAQIIALCARLGIDSARAPLFTLSAARAHAALFGRTMLTDDDIRTAAELTLAHRATQMPAEDDDQDAPPEPDSSETNAQAPDEQPLELPDELLLEAVRALIPDDLLSRLAPLKTRSARGSGTGARKTGSTRGRPLPSRHGRLSADARLDVVATLRAAAPWQTIRAKARPDHHGLHIYPTDIRLRRYEDRADRLLIFTVDASGSAAIARLAEAKGAVELLLAQAYARRDHVSLVSFRGATAETLLPPTRSLVQTKRRLAALPGGGGTPLAAGLQEAMTRADAARRKGLTPTIALLTDGRANIALDGTANRIEAAADAQRMARLIRATGTEAIVIDTGKRPEASLRTLAATMDATYLPMPRANAETLSNAVTSAMDV